MINKKLVLLVLSASAMGLVACGGGGKKSSKTSSSEQSITSGEVQKFDLTSGESINYWCTSGDTEFIAARVAEFKAAHPEFKGDITLKGNYDEDKVAAELKKDLDASADVFEIVDNDLPGAVAAKTLQVYEDADVGEMATLYGVDTVAKVKVLGAIYGVPYRNDNSYVLSYDKRIVSDEQAKTVEGIIAACAAKGATFNYAISNSWYGFAPVWGAGAKTYTDDTGAYHAEVAGDAIAQKVWDFVQIVKNAGSTFKASDDDKGFADGTVGAVIKWNNEGAQAANLDSNLAIAKLPTYTSGGAQIPMMAMHGHKTWSMKKGLSAGKLLTARAFTLFMGGDAVGEKRVTELKHGVPNIAVKAKTSIWTSKWVNAVQDMIKDNLTVSQLSAGVGSFWSPVEGFGKQIERGEFESLADVKDALEALQTELLG